MLIIWAARYSKKELMLLFFLRITIAISIRICIFTHKRYCLTFKDVGFVGQGHLCVIFILKHTCNLFFLLRF